MIRIENLSHKIDGNPILNDLSLEIPKHQITALVGANGAGKSTLLSLIARLSPLQTGTIHVDELEIGQCSSDALARRLSILPQVIHMEARLTIRELVSFGRYPHCRGKLSDKDWRKVDEAIEVLDLKELQHRPIDQLSGGQRQRAYVAMTYAQDTEYMLLDEPLNNMDIAASRSLMRLLRQLCKDHGRAIVIVLHDINYASGYADNIVALANGTIKSAGAPKDIVTTEFLKSIFATDAEVHMVGDRPYVLV